MVSAAAGAALIALAILLKRRRTQEKKAAQLPALPPTIDDTTLEQGPDQRSRVQFPVIPQLPTVHLDSDNENGGEMP